MLDQLDLGNSDLRDYLSNKQKVHSEEPVYILPSQCGQAGCQLVTMYSVHCCLGSFPIASPSDQ